MKTKIKSASAPQYLVKYRAFFRDSTDKKAHELKLTGWVKNLSNGDVELVACGDRDAIVVLTEWLWKGPPSAAVSNIHWEEIAWEDHSDFSIR